MLSNSTVYQKEPRLLLTVKSAAVFALTSSKLIPSAISVSSMVPAALSTVNTASSVMIVLTVRAPVRGKEHSLRIFDLPFFEQCSITAITFVLSGLETRSIAPPMPRSDPSDKKIDIGYDVLTFEELSRNHEVGNISCF